MQSTSSLVEFNIQSVVYGGTLHYQLCINGFPVQEELKNMISLTEKNGYKR